MVLDKLDKRLWQGVLCGSIRALEFAIRHFFGVTVSLLTAAIEPFPMPKNTLFTEANTVFQNEIDLIWEGNETFDVYEATVEERVNAVLHLERTT